MQADASGERPEQPRTGWGGAGRDGRGLRLRGACKFPGQVPPGPATWSGRRSAGTSSPDERPPGRSDGQRPVAGAPSVGPAAPEGSRGAVFGSPDQPRPHHPGPVARPTRRPGSPLPVMRRERQPAESPPRRQDRPQRGSAHWWAARCRPGCALCCAVCWAGDHGVHFWPATSRQRHCEMH
jgi:hypothetical protein